MKRAPVIREFITPDRFLIVDNTRCAYRISLDTEILRAMAAKAARNARGASYRGPLKVEIVSRETIG